MTKIGCAGILVEDIFCGPLRHLPREGQLLAVDSMPVKAGGCAANVAIGLTKQGWAVEVAGCLGRDASAEVLLACLRQHGVECAQVSRVERHATSRTVVLLVEGEDRRYLHAFGANRAFTVGHIGRDWLESLDLFYFGGLFALPAVETAELLGLLEFCRTRKIVTVVDVVVPQFPANFGEFQRLLAYIDYFLPNGEEARQITGRSDPLEQLRTFGDAGANTVIITRDKAGAVAGRTGEYWQCGVFPVTVVDPSGSGDAFSAGIITGVLRGWDMPQTLRYASALGASATRAVGTTDGVFTAAEAEEFVASRPLPIACGAL